MGKLIRDILEESVTKFADIKAVKWLEKKEILERSYRELMENVVAIRKGLLAEGFSGKHIALIGTSSVEWIESYLAIVTGKTVAVPLDAGLPAEDLMDLINRSDSEALFLGSKHKVLLDGILAECPKIRKIWLLQEEAPEALGDKVVSLAEIKTASQNSEMDSDRPDPDDVATIIYTSGTTGKSKGVMLTQNNLATNVLSVTYTKEPGTVMLSVL
ncbi:MAG: AMP-binding protein, partial [Eubacteriales bacterium]|nr:AMP-binding protein [Eubacteriales bacterium]